MKRVLFVSFVFCLGIFFCLSAAPAASAADTIKIGAIYPLTGVAASAGKELRAGSELAAEIVNKVVEGLDITIAKNAGIKSLNGAKIELIFKDHEGNPTLGADLAKKLITDDKVVGMIGCWHSSVTKTVSAVCERYGIPMINDSSSSPTLTKRGFKWFWRTFPHDKWFIKDFFTFLTGMTEGKVKGVKAIPKSDIINVASACEKTEFGASNDDLIKQFAEEYGFKLKKSLLYAAKAPDVSSEVRSLKAAKPDVMIFVSYTSDAILFIKTLKAQKAKPKIIWGQDAGFETPEFRETLGGDIEGVLTRAVFLPKIAMVKKAAGQVNKLYNEKMGHNMSGASARSFVGVQTWAHVLEQAGSTKPADIQKTANSIHIPGEELVLPWGGVKFATTGEEPGQNELGSGLIAQYQKGPDGKVEMEIVYPFDVATKDMIYPFKGF